MVWQGHDNDSEYSWGAGHEYAEQVYAHHQEAQSVTAMLLMHPMDDLSQTQPSSRIDEAMETKEAQKMVVSGTAQKRKGCSTQ